jgi:hypothetical protein
MYIFRIEKFRIRVPQASVLFKIASFLYNNYFINTFEKPYFIMLTLPCAI